MYLEDNLILFPYFFLFFDIFIYFFKKKISKFISCSSHGYTINLQYVLCKFTMYNVNYMPMWKIWKPKYVASFDKAFSHVLMSQSNISNE